MKQQTGTENLPFDTSVARPVVAERTSEISHSMAASAIPQISSTSMRPTGCNVALLTGGDDKPYVLGLVSALTSNGIIVDVIGSNDLDVPDLLHNSRVNFLNLRGDQRLDANLASKITRVLRYYWRLLAYAITTKVGIFHILWNNKFEVLDRTLLMLYYRVMGRRTVLTAHNVNMRKRDGTDSWLNRSSLKIQYRLSDHIFVHTQQMKSDLLTDFGVPGEKTSVIPFGINNTVPNSSMTAVDAKRMLGIRKSDKVILCFGQIAPYKGLEYLIDAFREVAEENASYWLIIAGKVKKGQTKYWNEIRRKIANGGIQNRITERIEHIPDEEVEVYFKAADVLSCTLCSHFPKWCPVFSI